MRTLGAFALFLLAVTGFSQAAVAADTSRQAIITQDGDYYGFDLRTEQNVTLDQCKQACLGDNACKAFTYNPKVSWCFLKSDFYQLNPFPGAVAGKIVETTAEADIGAAPRLSFLSDQLLADARAMRDNLVVADQQQGLGVNALLSAAGNALAAGNIDLAIASFRGALSLNPGDADLWLEMASAANRVTGNSATASQAAMAAINGYQLTRTADARAYALSLLARSLENSENYRAALNTYKASLALVPAKTVEAAYLDLKARRGFRVVDHRIDADSASPRACVQFSEALVKTGADYASFVTLDGKAPAAVEAKDNQICVEGLAHGQRYKLALRAGLPSSVDEVLEAPVSLDLYIKDRSASVRFTGDSYVLPSTVRRGIPLVSVNTESADLTLYRIGDRSIASLLATSQFLTQLDGYSAQRIREESGEVVWQGRIDIQPELNREVVTSFPVDEALHERKPGVYVLTAATTNGRSQDWDAKATQWFVVSDIGISTYAGTDGLHVFARSLASAKPIEGVELQLVARNNEVLGTAKTDADGSATFTAGLMRGTAGTLPAVITARNGADDYVFLDMTRAGFDLSDRGVTGRPAPGAIDILAWTERGIYRAGETVHAAALARDVNGMSIEKLPLTFVFSRPDGVEDRRIVSDGGKLGGHVLDLALQDNAMRGTWSMQIFADPKGAAIADKQFLVDDFVPDRTEFDLTSTSKALDLGKPATIEVEGRFLYGAPAAGLQLEGEITIRPTRERAAFAGYVFGLADEEDNEDSRIPLDLAALDEDGQSSFEVTLDDLPATTKLLDGAITVRMREAGGRAIERSLTLPIQPQGPMIGIKPEFAGALAENAIATFHVVTIDVDGMKVATPGLAWKLVAIERNYQWYRDGSSWRYEPVMSTKQIATGRLDTTADGGEISVPVSWGRYRLEIDTANINGPASSVEFDAGWYVAQTSTETPDGLEIALDKESYAIGDVAKLKVSPRFAGELMVTVGTETLIASRTAGIPTQGGEIDLPVTAEWGAGAYVTATLFRPGEAQESRMPMRAIGVKWLAVDPGHRKLSVRLEAPDKTLPRQPLDIALKVEGAGADEDAYVTLAAVDVGILNLTRYQAPDPEGWYFGQRQLGLEIRDLYGRLIDGSLGATGRLRTGGDGGQMPMQGSPPTEKLVAFFSGPVKLDGDGRASVSFDIPQFNGTARLMAVAWTKSGVGHAVQDVVIRDPVVVTASLPKFLAPGDNAALRLDIANTDAPAGDYRLQVTTNGVVTVAQQGPAQTLRLEKDGRQHITLPLSGGDPGDGQITVGLTGDAGLSLEQVLTVPVRPATLPITQRQVVSVAPHSGVTIDAELLADSILPGAAVSVNVTRTAAFDIPALLMSLDRYPYGCTEQTTSRALPLLYVGELGPATGLVDADQIRSRVQDAIYGVIANQSSSGSFGLWGPDSGDLWLDAYVTDFLTRAREQSFEVPDAALVQALENLQNSLSYETNVEDRGNEIAYALYVLARNRKAAISDLRYYADTMLPRFPTPLAKAHLAAALALYGDGVRSQSIFADSLGMSTGLVNVSLARSDYGSSLRDDAAVLSLAAESRPVPPIIPELSRIVARQWDAATYTSTQEQAWMLLAARAIAAGDTDIRLTVNGVERSGAYSARVSGDAIATHPLTIRNEGTDPVSAVVTTIASPAQPRNAGGDGFTITRAYYTLAGEQVNISEARQNQRYVVVLKVTQANDWSSRVLITDLLPAGLEIDNPRLVNSAELANFEWIGQVEAAHTEFRFDRFVAAFNRAAGDTSDITLAYVVRAVTPGTYDQPAASVEDMYRPQFSARTATGRMEVLAVE